MSDLYISEDVKKEYILFSFGVCFIPALALARALKPNELHNILLYSYYILLFGVCISLYFAIKDYMLGIQIESSRLALTRLSPIQLGKYSVFLCIISYGLLLHKNKTKKISFLFLLCSITLGVVTIVLSGSRTAFVGLVLICLLNLFLRISITKILMILILLPVFAYISLTAVSYVIPELDIVDKYLSMGDVNDQSANIRYELYHGALQQFSTSPLFGDFFLEREYMYAPHNLTLEVMMSLGVLGLIAFISIVLFSLVKLLVLIKVSGKNESSLYMTCFNLLAYLLIASNFSLGITTASEIWALCILSLFLLTSKSTVKFSENKTY
ncbi:O-antigen ligase family protein [Vibrio parahaemolyticus]|nr:O-antigen ligase family protein [Vibrio parahaemolyticus]